MREVGQDLWWRLSNLMPTLSGWIERLNSLRWWRKSNWLRGRKFTTHHCWNHRCHLRRWLLTWSDLFIKGDVRPLVELEYKLRNMWWAQREKQGKHFFKYIWMAWQDWSPGRVSTATRCRKATGNQCASVLSTCLKKSKQEEVKRAPMQAVYGRKKKYWQNTFDRMF